MDCGGGTVDITANKMIIDKKGEMIIEEMTPTRGGNHGGFAVNEQFESMLRDLFGISPSRFKMIKEKHARQWMKLIWSDFETSKNSVRAGDTTATISIAIHRNIRNEVKKVTGCSIESLVKGFKKNDVWWDEDEDSIVLSYSTICSLYHPALAKIIYSIHDVLLRCNNVEMVFLVGGFSESSLLVDKIKESLAQRMPPIEVKQSSLPMFSVAIGAILCEGLTAGGIQSLQMKYSIKEEAYIRKGIRLIRNCIMNFIS